MDSETLQIAKEELREDEVTRENALTQIRLWLRQNKKIINSRTDENFLLRFLRAKKFSLPLAQEALERYLLLRQTFGQRLFYKLDVKCPRLEKLLSLGYIFVVPKRDKNGRRIIITRPGVFDPSKWTNEDMCRMHGMTYETLMEDQINQVRGFVHYTDAAGMSLQQMTLFTPREAIRIVKNGERTLPMRHKEIYGVNVPTTLKYALDFGMSLVSEKIRSRVKIFSTIEESHSYVDKTLLPKEYGGETEMSTMIDLWREELLEKREQILKNEKMSVEEDLFSEGARQGRVSALNNNSPQFMVGSFRKLAVD
ncbi:alpha-tocopherol transfer protein-like isoform X2 [Adelges cooleyi]|uniref:alpha-tocopherol transfer protein-like isoform X2 n=1 Tax=Adelges cooleyi TaxID=133065 RepID=UPI0021801689|nr:alpha-tocopherol transfer protein-like isoform X2 [Adelges cooleyi]